MKKILLTVAVLLSFAATTNLYAQHCVGASGSSVCTPIGGLTQMGFYPPDTALPCAVVGTPFDTVVQVHTPATAQGYNVNWIQIKNLINLPCGFCWRSNSSTDKINGNATGCVRVNGTTYDAPGEYNMIVYADVNVTVGIFPLTITALNLDTALGLHYYARVKLPGGTCVPVDTNSPGLTAHTAGTLTAPTISGTTTICSGGNTTLTASGTGIYSYVWSTGALTSSISVSSAGTYTVTAYGNCTSATASKTVTVSNPSSTISANGPTTFCQGSSVTLDAGAGFSAYSWSNGATTQTTNISAAGTYKCTVTLSGCQGTSNTVTVTVNNNPTPTVTANGATTFCQGGSVTLDAGAGYSTYAWSNGGATQTISPSLSGTYTCTVTQNGCSGTSNTTTVTVNNNPAPVLSPNGPTSFCAGSNVTLDAGGGYSSYVWSNAATTQTINVSNSGTYTCTVMQNGCTGNSNTVTVTVTNPTPTVTPSGATTFCQGGNVSLDAGAGYAAYNWSNNASTQQILVNQSGTYTVTVTQNGCQGTSNTITVTVNNTSVAISHSGPTTFCTGGSVTLNAGSGYDTYAWSNASTSQSILVSTGGTYTVTVSKNGCTATDQEVVTVVSNNLTPSITPASPINICPGATAVLDAGAGYDSYAWSNASSSQTINVTTQGTYSVTVTQGACSGSVSATVNVGNFPAVVNITASGPLSVCAGTNLSLDAGAGYSSYNWSGGQTSQTINVTTSGSYIVTVTQNNCVGTDTVDVTVKPLPTPSISPSGTQTICPGQTLTLDAGTSYDTYLWSDNSTTQTIDVTASGNYNVTVTKNGCTGSGSAVTVNVSGSLTPSVTPSGVQPVCSGNSITLDAGSGYDTYAWSNSATTQTISVSAAGNYTVTVTQGACSGSSNVVTVTVTALPTPTISPSGTQTICSGQTTVLDAGTGYSSYLWSTTETSQTIQAGTAGVYHVTVTQNGCSGSDVTGVTVSVTALPNPTITPSGVQNICSGQTLTLDAGSGYSSYLWTNGQTTQTIVVDTTGTYNVAVSQNSCTGSSSTPANVFVNVTPNATYTDLDIFGGNQLVVSPANGTTYTWLGASDTVAGPYTVVDVTSSNIDTGYCMGSLVISNGGYSRSFSSFEFISVVVATGAGCKDTSTWDLLHYNCSGGVNEISTLSNFEVKPNPAKDVLNISYELNDITPLKISIIDLTGRKVIDVVNATQTKGTHQHTLNLTELPQGVYFVNMMSYSGSFNSKFIKQ